MAPGIMKDYSAINADCKARWHNVELMVDGLNPYKVWRELGGYTTDIPEQSG